MDKKTYRIPINRNKRPDVDPTAMDSVKELRLLPMLPLLLESFETFWNTINLSLRLLKTNKITPMDCIHTHLIISFTPSTSSTFHVTQIPSYPPNHGLLRNFLGFRRFHETPQRRTNQLRLDLSSHEFEVQLVHCWLVASLEQQSKPL